MPSYRVVYGDDEHSVTETLDGVVVETEDGWVTFFRGKDVILRVQETHLRSMDVIS
jgi:hypothetical protein